MIPKFRAWIKSKKCMVIITSIEYNYPDGSIKFIMGNYIVNGANVSGGPYYPDNFVPMQFTGFEDDSGDDIYEGDIILREHTYIDILDTAEKASKLLTDYTFSVEILGNVYEHPDLLREVLSMKEPQNYVHWLDRDLRLPKGEKKCYWGKELERFRKAYVFKMKNYENEPKDVTDRIEELWEQGGRGFYSVVLSSAGPREVSCFSIPNEIQMERRNPYGEI